MNMRKTLDVFLEFKKDGRKISMLTCYDYPTAVIQDRAGIDIIFTGDSVGTNVLGYKSEKEVTMDDMIHHLKAVRRGVSRSYLLVDMPYKSYDTPRIALENAKRFIQNGADGVKLEGVQIEVVRKLAKNGIEVVGHLGLNPQKHIKKKVKGKSFESAKKMTDDACKMEEAGIKMLVLELVPEEIGQLVTGKIDIPVIGIAAGRFCDGQVQIINDILGVTAFKYKHVKQYQNYNNMTYRAVKQYSDEVQNGLFPGEENVVHMKKEIFDKLKKSFVK